MAFEWNIERSKMKSTFSSVIDKTKTMNRKVHNDGLKTDRTGPLLRPTYEKIKRPKTISFSRISKKEI